MSEQHEGNERAVIPRATPPQQSQQDAWETWQAFGRSLTDGLAALSTWLNETFAPLMQQIAPAMQALSDAVYQRYLDAGAPYGETSDGFVRWVQEPSEAERLWARAEAIEQHHRMLADFRRQLAQHRSGHEDTP